jgi:hypothetical protein
VTYFEWSAQTDQKIIIPWRVIDGPETADAVANEIMHTPVRRGSRTSISGAIYFALPLFEEKSVSGLASRGRHFRRWSEQQPPVAGERQAALEKGITINGLPIMVKEPSYSTMDIDNLDLYYEDCVIGGPGAFACRSGIARNSRKRSGPSLFSKWPDGRQGAGSFRPARWSRECPV